MSATVKLLQERRARLVGAILGHAEREFYSRLTAQQQRDFRQKVLSVVDTYHDFMLDLVKVYEGGDDDAVMINEEALRLIRDLHRRVGDGAR